MEKKIKLFSACVAVKGFKRSVICDFQRSKVKFISNFFYEILVWGNGKSIDQIVLKFGHENSSLIVDFVNYLVQNEYAFWCDDPELFPDIDLTWETPDIINNGIIDCNELSNHNFKNIFYQFDLLGCKHLEIRYFDAVPLDTITNNIIFTEGSRLNSIALIVKYSKDTTKNALSEIASNFKRISTISVHSTPETELEKLKDENQDSIKFFSQVINSNSHCGNISSEYFVLDQDLYLESLKYNTCLNKKISIDVDGSIKNCPSMKTSFGNINETSLNECVIKDNFKSLWNISKDQIEICKDCEFRYICTDCRAFLESDNSLKKPLKCNYNPYTAIWENSL